MTTIAISDVQKLADQSAFAISQDEAVAMQKDLAGILDYVKQLDEVDTAGVEPMYQPHNLETVTRPDEIIDYGISQTELLKNTPKHDGGSIVVPRVLE